MSTLFESKNKIKETRSKFYSNPAVGTYESGRLDCGAPRVAKIWAPNGRLVLELAPGRFSRSDGGARRVRVRRCRDEQQQAACASNRPVM